MQLASIGRRFLLPGAFLAALFVNAHAQQPVPSPTPGDEVIRVSTELVQTDLTVIDRNGSFIDGLKRDQFELKIDGKPREIAFFERIVAGSKNEEAQLAAARGARSKSAGDAAPVPLDRGRIVLFFVDDFHLSPSSIYQTRLLLTRFIDHEMGQNDQAVICSTSGHIGFLQQLTDDKAVLHAAVERITAQSKSLQDGERPPMSEYQAQQIDNNERDTTDYFIDELLKENPRLPRQLAGDMVRARASAMLQQAANYTRASLSTMQGLIRSTAELPGRKVLFLVSDGFLLDNRNSDSYERVRNLSTSAAHSGIVIYSIDARGLIASLNDASNPAGFDPSGRLQRSQMGEIPATQDGMNALAVDTGGRAIFNTNALSTAVTTALKETSVYYLLAWRPETEDERLGKIKHFQISVTSRPELTVRVRQNFGNTTVAEKAPGKKEKTNEDTRAKSPPAQDPLRGALQSLYPKTSLPVSVATTFLNLPSPGSVMAANMKILTTADMFAPEAGKLTANVDIAGVLFDDHGKPVGSFADHLVVKAITEKFDPSHIDSLFYNYRFAPKPGLYQIRVAARDEKSGRTGSATHWIQIPDLGPKQLTLSSILVGENHANGDSSSAPPATADNKPVDPFKSVTMSIDHHFAHSSRLRFMIFAYNAAVSPPLGAAFTANPAPIMSNPAAPAGPPIGPMPDIAVQVQVLRDNQPVLTTPLRKIGTEGITDLARLPYAAELPLQDLPSGRYLLKVTVIDRIAKASASQQLDFQVD